MWSLFPSRGPILAGRLDPSLLTGSAPNVYRLTRQGLKHLEAEPPPGWHVASPYRVAHELFVREALVWAQGAAHHHGLEEAETRLAVPVMLSVQPDGVLILRLRQGRVLVGLIEVDRGTERGEKHWRMKTDGYAALFASGSLEGFTGYKGARVLVIAHTLERAEHLAALVERLRPEEAFRYWFTDRQTLATSDLSLPLWTNRGVVTPMVESAYLSASGLWIS